MISWYRTANIAPGKLSVAVAFAKDVAAYVTTKTGVEFQSQEIRIALDGPRNTKALRP
jgi:hypothetical protein